MRRLFPGKDLDEIRKLIQVSPRLFEMSRVHEVFFFIFECIDGLLIPVSDPEVIIGIVEVREIGHLLKVPALGANQGQFYFLFFMVTLFHAHVFSRNAQLAFLGLKSETDFIARFYGLVDGANQLERLPPLQAVDQPGLVVATDAMTPRRYSVRL